MSKLLEIVKGRVAWPVAVHEVAKSQTQLSDKKTTTIHPAFICKALIPSGEES